MIAYSIGLTVVIGIAVWKLADAELLVARSSALNLAPDSKELARLIAEFKGLMAEQFRWWKYGINGIVWSTWLTIGLVMLPQGRR